MTRQHTLALAALAWLGSIIPVTAQPAPTITSTLQTTDTSTTSIKVGCALGSGSCTGGITGGPISATLISLGSGYVEIQSFVPASQTNRLVNNSGTLQWNGSPLAIGGSISGTTNTIPVFTASNAIGNSIMTQSGTTITVANTLSATTLTGTLSTASQPNVTTMGGLTSASSLASVGTITSGTWSGTIIGLAKGGTAADLSGTGGTSQFLRQNTLGGAITVVRPATADLSDSSHIIVDTGSYANPAWITSLNGGKITGANSLSDSVLSTNVPLLNNNNAYTSGFPILGVAGSAIRIGQVCDVSVTNSCMFPQLGTFQTAGNTRLTTDAIVAGFTQLSIGGGINIGAATTSTALTGNTDNYNVVSGGNGTIIRMGSTGSFNLTGVVAPADQSGRFYWLWNSTPSNTTTLKHDSASSLSGNRFYCPGAVDYAMSPFKSVLLVYSQTDSHWLVIGGS